MQTGMLLLFWVVNCGLTAFVQGRILPAVRRTPYGTIEQKEQDIALHYVGGFLYFWPLLFTPNWLALTVALGLRVLLFDVVLNKAAGDAPFNVGKTARTDKMLRKIAVLVNLPASYISALIRLLAFLLLAVVVYVQITN